MGAGEGAVVMAALAGSNGTDFPKTRKDERESNRKERKMRTEHTSKKRVVVEPDH